MFFLKIFPVCYRIITMKEENKQLSDNLRLAKNIMLARILTQNACESSEERNRKKLLTVKVRTLFLIGEYGEVSPSLLIDKLFIAKSNLALICKQLLTEGLIETSQDLEDKRIIYYNLTSKGKDFLDDKLKAIQKNVSECSDYNAEEFADSLEKINKVLNKKF